MELLMGSGEVRRELLRGCSSGAGCPKIQSCKARAPVNLEMLLMSGGCVLFSEEVFVIQRHLNLEQQLKSPVGLGKPSWIPVNVSWLSSLHVPCRTEHSQVRLLTQPRAWLHEVEEICTKIVSNLFSEAFLVLSAT